MWLVERGDETCFGVQGGPVGPEDCLSDPVFTTSGNGVGCRRRGDVKILAAPSLGREVMNMFLVTEDRRTGHNSFSQPYE
jgi:hypothetical protein